MGQEDVALELQQYDEDIEKMESQLSVLKEKRKAVANSIEIKMENQEPLEPTVTVPTQETQGGLTKTWDPGVLKRVSEDKKWNKKQRKWLENPSKMSSYEDLYAGCGALAIIVFLFLTLALAAVTLADLYSSELGQQAASPTYHIMMMIGLDVLFFLWNFWRFNQLSELQSVILEGQKKQVSWKSELKGALIKKKMGKTLDHI